MGPVRDRGCGPPRLSNPTPKLVSATTQGCLRTDHPPRRIRSRSLSARRVLERDVAAQGLRDARGLPTEGSGSSSDRTRQRRACVRCRHHQRDADGLPSDYDVGAPPRPDVVCSDVLRTRYQPMLPSRHSHENPWRFKSSHPHGQTPVLGALRYASSIRPRGSCQPRGIVLVLRHSGGRKRKA